MCTKPSTARLCVALVVGIVVIMVLGGCIQGEAEAKPPEIHFGEDLCAACGMVISDPRFASALAWEVETNRYESLAFDDVGDMASFIRDNADRNITDYWVHDYESEEWVDATVAWYVISPQIQSPMMHGVAAFATEEAALTFAPSVEGEVLDWNQMRATVLMHNH
jgi:copper chaperone NosL